MAGKGKQNKPKNQPPQKKKPAKAKAVSAASVPGKAQSPKFRNLGQIYNPFSHAGPVPVSDYEGKAVCMRSTANDQVTVSSAVDTLILLTNTGHGVQMMCRVVIGPTPALSQTSGNYLRELPTAGGPTSGRAMRFGVEVQNTSKRFDMGGRIFTLVSSERQLMPAVADSMTAAQWQTIADDIAANPKTVGHNGALLEHPIHLYSTPHTQKSYLEYNTWDGDSENAVNFFKHATTNANGGMLDMPMSSIWILFKSSTAQNTYNVRVHGDYNVRYGAGNVLSTKMVHTPTAPAEMLNAAGVAGSELGRGRR